MEETDLLEALSNLLTELSNNPYDISLHAQYIRLAESSGMKDQIQAAREMMIGFWPASEEVWLPIIRSRIDEGVDNVESVQEILTRFELAELDYLSIPILQEHMNFVIDRYAYISLLEARPAELGEEMFTVDWTRARLTLIADKGAGHMTKSHLLWNLLRDWELEQLEKSEGDERELHIMLLDDFFLRRLKQSHAEHNDTFQSYSTFTSTYRPPSEYEKLLVTASKIRAQAVKGWERREQYEMSLAASEFSPEAYAFYITNERKPKKIDVPILTALYERAITDTARRRFNGDLGAENALRIFWAGYCDVMRINDSSGDTQLHIIERAVRSVPGCGEIWARYMRFTERNFNDEEVLLQLTETIPEIYDKALAMGLLQKDVDQYIPFALARAGYEKRLIENDNDDEGDAEKLFKLIEEGIRTVREARKEGDPQLRLEKFFANFCLAELPDTAIAVWQSTAKHYKSSYLAWTIYIDLLSKQGRVDEARNAFKDIVTKNLDWPEAIFETWISFEHLHGSVEEIEECMDKVDRAQNLLNARRLRDSEKQAYQMSQKAAEAQASVPVSEAQAVTYTSGMEVDVPVSEQQQTGQKRKTDETSTNGENKRAKTEQPLTLKRDRENCTVFVADLPNSVTKDELEKLFKDCGMVREVKIVKLPSSIVATVEFMDRESIAAALTKDKKRLDEQEISVHLAWKSTLYVTNFPDKMSDKPVRELFGKFGQIFDVRWPSKKFKNTRRFCYVQFTSPEAAQAALSLQGQELEPGLALTVYISDPERRKERTDAGNDNREIYVAGLSKFANKADLEKLFGTYGVVKDVRMANTSEGTSKGFAFVEFENEVSAQRALQANNFDFKNRRIAVTLADSRVRARQRNEAGSSGQALKSETKSRSIRIKGLPEGTQEGLLQQVLERIVPVKRLEVFEGKREAVVELPSVADAGKLLLLAEPLKYNDTTLKIMEELDPILLDTSSRNGGAFVPRAAVSRPRAGIGSKPKAQVGKLKKAGDVDKSMPPPPQAAIGGRSQEEFRKMLG